MRGGPKLGVGCGNLTRGVCPWCRVVVEVLLLLDAADV